MRRGARRVLAVALLTAAAGPSAAAPLTLDAAMARGRERAREVTAAAARLEAAEAQARQARGHRLPTVQAQEVWMRTDAPAEAFALTLEQERFSFADFVAGDPNHPEAVENAMTRLELSLPLYTGGELSRRIEQAELAAAAAGDTLRRAEHQAAVAAGEAWIRLAQAREHAALLERSLETVAAHVDLAQAYVDQGMLVTSELLRAQVERARVADMLAEARGQARLAEAGLSFRLGAPLGESWQLEPLPPPTAPAGDLETWLTAADERADLAAARQMVAVAELQEGVARAARLPRVALVGRYDLNDDRPFGGHGDSSAVMAMARVDLFAGGRHAAAEAAAAAEARAAAADVERFAEGVALGVRQAWERAVTARERQATALAALEAARESERITEERFRQGVVKTIDLLDAATARREAETRELIARAEANLATLQLALEAGQDPVAGLSRTAEGDEDTP